MRKGSVVRTRLRAREEKGCVWNSSAQAKDPLTEEITQQDNDFRAEEACGISVITLNKGVLF